MPLESTENRSASAESKAGSATDIADLTRRLAEADEMAFRTFHSLYFHRLARYLLVVAHGDEQAMRDAVQETFRRVAKHVRSFSDEAIFWSWLTTVARTALFDQRRATRRYLAFLDRFRRHSVDRAAPNGDHGDSLRELLEQNLAALEPDERAIVEWKYFDHCAVRDIAARLGTTESAVESRLVRVRRKLKDSVLADLRDESHA